MLRELIYYAKHRGDGYPDSREKLLIANLEIDPHQIGELIGYGGLHRTFLWKSDSRRAKVIKFPTDNKLFDRNYKQQLDNILLFKDYFGPYYHPTQIFHYNSAGLDHLLMQDFIDSREHISPVNFSEFSEQFVDIVARNKKLMRDRSISIDFIGPQAFKWILNRKQITEPNMSNILIDRDLNEPQIKLFDFDVFNLASPKTNLKNRLRGKFRSALFKANREFINHFYRVDIVG